MRFSAFLVFAAAWLLFVYVPIAHWVWGGGFLATVGVLDFAVGTVVHRVSRKLRDLISLCTGNRCSSGTALLNPTRCSSEGGRFRSASFLASQKIEITFIQ